MPTKEIIQRARAICTEWTPRIEAVLNRFHSERGSPFTFGYCEAYQYTVNNGVRDETATELGVYWDIKNLSFLTLKVSLDGAFRVTLELPSKYHLGIDEGFEERLYTRLGEAVAMGPAHDSPTTIERRAKWMEDHIGERSE